MVDRQFIQRIDERLKALNLSDRKASLKAGLGTEGIRAIRRGHQPSVERVNALARALEVEPAYLIGQEGERPLPDSVAVFTTMADGYVPIPRFDAALSAGTGSIVDPNADPLGYQIFEQQWLRDVTRATADHLAIVRVAGDSMEPTLRDGDWVLVDRTQRSLNREGIYALQIGDAAWVKRITLNLRQRLVRIISDNTAYPMEELEEDILSVIGRVVWIVGRKV